MRNRLPTSGLLVIIGLLALGTAVCKKEARTSLMLRDDKAAATAEDKALAESSKPQPLPAEPYPSARADELKPSAMLKDVEELEKEEMIPAAPGEARPRPLPEEPKPLKKEIKK